MNRASRLGVRGLGFTMIELLVVLIIVGILAYAGLSELTPKSPKATRSVLLDVRNDIQNARQAAIASGRTVRLKCELVNGQWRFWALDIAMAETLPAATFFTDMLPLKAMSYCTLASAFTDLPTTSTVVTALPPAVTYGFGPAATGWNNCLAGSTTFGFSPTGSTVMFTGTAPAVVTTSVLNGGFWVGVLGRTPNASGNPYGTVLVTQQGQVVTYYKGDSMLDDSPDHKWTRLE